MSVCVCVCGGGGGGGYDVLKFPFQEKVRDKAQLIAKQLGLEADTSHQVNSNLIVYCLQCTVSVSVTCGVTTYARNWRKDALNRCLQFSIISMASCLSFLSSPPPPPPPPHCHPAPLQLVSRV